MSQANGYLTIYLWSGNPVIVPINLENEKALGDQVEECMRSRTNLRLVYTSHPETTCCFLHGSLIAGFRTGPLPGWVAGKLQAPEKKKKKDEPRSDVNDADWWKDPGGRNPFDADSDSADPE